MGRIEELKHKKQMCERLIAENTFPIDSEELETTRTELTDTTYELNQEMYRLHKISEKGNPYEIIDSHIADYVVENYHLMILLGKPYIYENGVYREDKEGIKIKSIIKGLIFSDIVTHIRITRVYKLIIEDIRIQVDLDDINQYLNYWINFKNGMLDVKTGKIHPHSPKYKSVNQIPHHYIAGLDIKDSVFHQFLLSRIPDEENRKMLYEYMGYCLLPTVLFREFMILVGKGNAGKSVILTQLERILGKENVSAISMQKLADNRFASSKLLNKQCNIFADLPDGAINDTSTIKQLTGDDLIGAEYKHGDFFEFRNRAKLIFSCNAIPSVLNDRSDAFYSRLLIIRFYEEGEYIPDLKKRLAEEKEIEILISYLVQGAKNVVEGAKLYRSGANSSEVLQLQKESDTVTAFLDECTERDKKSREKRSDIFETYKTFCEKEERQPLGRTAFFKALETKGYQKTKIQGIYYIRNIKIGFMNVDKVPFDV